MSEYTLRTPFGLVAGGVALGIRPWGIPLTLRFGPEIGVLAARPFDQREELVAPASAVFLNTNGERTQVRNVYSGELEQPGLQVGAQFQVDYDLPLNRDETMLVTPEFSVTLPLTRVRSDLDWRIHQVRAGVALKYSLPVNELPPQVKDPLPPPPPVRDPVLAAEFSVMGVSGGREQDGFHVTVEEFVSTQMRSLLPYIFFEEGASELPGRYVQIDADRAEGFGLAALHNRSTLDVYYHTLNTVGMRMRQHPGARLTLIGTNSDRGIEQGNTALSRARAETVKTYLVDVWGIEPDRIATSARNLPSTPSNPDDADGIAENRRVEMVSTIPAILEPVTTTDTVRVIDPPVLRLKMSARADAGIGSWRARIDQSGAALKEYSGSSSLPPTVDWNMALDDRAAPRGGAPMHATFELQDGRGKAIALADTVDVKWISVRKKREERLGDTAFQRFNLITFAFDRSVLTPANLRIVNSMRSRVDSTSIVDVAGYTDRVGDAAHNRELSRQRAVNTARALNVSEKQAVGFGESVDRFDNNLPEGRFLSRSVDVIIKSPITGE